jgi:hypothetical protein
MKITISDKPLDSQKEGVSVISDKQYKKLEGLGSAFQVASSPKFSLEIEAVKIEAAYINYASEMTAIKFRIAFNPFLDFHGRQLAKDISMTALWEVNTNILWFNGWEVTSAVYVNFPRDRSDRMDLTAISPEEFASYLLEALAKTVEKVCFSLNKESEHLQTKADQLRRSGMRGY